MARGRKKDVVPNRGGMAFGRNLMVLAAVILAIGVYSIDLLGSTNLAIPIEAFVTEHLGVKHLRAIVGQSMGGMHAWVWGVRYPHFADALVPLRADA